eukprot:gene9066-biopygen151
MDRHACPGPPPPAGNTQRGTAVGATRAQGSPGNPRGCGIVSTGRRARRPSWVWHARQRCSQDRKIRPFPQTVGHAQQATRAPAGQPWRSRALGDPGVALGTGRAGQVPWPRAPLRLRGTLTNECPGPGMIADSAVAGIMHSGQVPSVHPSRKDLHSGPVPSLHSKRFALVPGALSAFESQRFALGRGALSAFESLVVLASLPFLESQAFLATLAFLAFLAPLTHVATLASLASLAVPALLAPPGGTLSRAGYPFCCTSASTLPDTKGVVTSTCPRPSAPKVGPWVASPGPPPGAQCPARQRARGPPRWSGPGGLHPAPRCRFGEQRGSSFPFRRGGGRCFGLTMCGMVPSENRVMPAPRWPFPGT